MNKTKKMICTLDTAISEITNLADLLQGAEQRCGLNTLIDLFHFYEDPIGTGHGDATIRDFFSVQEAVNWIFNETQPWKHDAFDVYPTAADAISDTEGKEALADKGYVINIDAVRPILPSELPTRTFNGLIRNEYQKTGSLIGVSLGKLQRIRNMGMKSIIASMLFRYELQAELFAPQKDGISTNADTEILVDAVTGEPVPDQIIRETGDISSAAVRRMEEYGVIYLSQLFSMDGRTSSLVLDTCNTAIPKDAERLMREYRIRNVAGTDFAKTHAHELHRHFHHTLIAWNTLIYIVEHEALGERSPEELIERLYQREELRRVVKETMANYLTKGHTTGQKVDVLEILPEHLRNSRELQIILDELVREKLIENNSDAACLCAITPDQYVENLAPGSERKKIWDMILQGHNMSEIGRKLGKSGSCISEIVRRDTRKMWKNELRWVYVAEQYARLFTEYKFTKEFFCEAFGLSELEFFVMNRRWWRNKDGKHIFEAVSDPAVPEHLRQKLKRAIAIEEAKAVKEFGTRARNERGREFVLELLKEHSQEILPIKEFHKLCIQEAQKRNRPLPQSADTSYLFDAYIRRFDCILFTQRKGVRYYDRSRYNIPELLSGLNLKQFAGKGPQSALDLYEANPDLMARFELLNGYELHNLLRYICEEHGVPVEFGRMPSFTVPHLVTSR